MIENMDNMALATWLVARTSMWIEPNLPRTKFLTEFLRCAHDIQG
jgi:hypothetical protein